MSLLDLAVKIGVEDKATGKVGSIASGIVSKIGDAAKAGAKAIGGIAVAGVGAAATAAGALGKMALDSYADFQQLEGGVAKLFGDASGSVMENAARAFETAGLSANEYMETVTSFSASLIAGLGGDTQLAADLADQAIRDMSDNANTFGTDMDSVMAAYQGFAKQNYTLLDNLKLGYGGTASEMARLINDSGILADQFEVTADNLSDVSFAQIIEAIHVVQDGMSITDTTAREAAGTVSGSIAMMQASWANFATALGGGGDLDRTINELMGSVGHVVENVMPVIERFASALSTAIPQILPQILSVITSVISQIAGMIPQVLPPLVTAVVEGLGAIVDALPQILPPLIQGIVDIIVGIADMLPTLMPTLIDAAVILFMALVDALPKIIPPLLSGIWAAITAAAQKVGEGVAPMMAAAGEFIGGLLTGVTNGFGAVVDFFAGIPGRLLGALGDVGSMLVGAGQSIISGFLSGITGAFSGVADFIGGIGPWIAEHKGPEDYDKNLLVNAGHLIMGGLAEGLEAGMGGVASVIGSTNDLISGGITARPRVALAASGSYLESYQRPINIYIDGNALHTDSRLRAFGIRFVEELELLGRA